MDKEQAIEIIETHSENISSGSLVGRALNMAIDALKAQLSYEDTTSDTINRQQAIRWVKTECNPYGKPTLEFESGKKVIEHLEQMPPAQPEPKEGHWIKHETPDGDEQYECSECGVLWEFNDGTPEDNEAYYCPKCGSYNGGGRK